MKEVVAKNHFTQKSVIKMSIGGYVHWRLVVTAFAARLGHALARRALAVEPVQMTTDPLPWRWTTRLKLRDVVIISGWFAVRCRVSVNVIKPGQSRTRPTHPEILTKPLTPGVEVAERRN